MKSFVILGLAAAAMAQSSPDGCSPSTEGTFQITTVNVSSSAKRDVQRRQLAGTLTCTLEGGILKDQAGRQGYIASNYQFQFDSPVQAGALQTEGFSLCGNQSLALGGSAVFYQCLSGTFYNLYSQSTGAQCIPIHIQAVNKGGESQISDSEPQASSAAPVVTQIPDGQPQASSAGAPVVTQISDGQPQAPEPVVTQISDGQPQAPAPAPVVTQISDGQPQAPAPVVTQISDGQPQAPAPVVTQISDGQPQASAPAPAPAPVVTQISDGQPQASAPAGPVVSQISDGQPQASAPAGPVVSQISDGQPQAPLSTGNVTRTLASAQPAPEFTGAAATSAISIGAFAAGMLCVLALL